MTTFESSRASAAAVQAPVASRIAASLRKQILAGELAAGDRLPAERELAKSFGVSPATVQKVLKELEREKLVKGQWGRGRFVTDWRGSKTWAVAVLLYEAAHLQHPVMMRRLAGIQPPLEEAGYHIHFIVMNRQARGEQEWPTLIPPSNFDGAIVVAHQAQPRQVFSLAERLPLVWMDHHSMSPNILGVRSDIIGGGLLAAEHLASLGHRRIALLNVGNSTTSQDQHEGVQLAARRLRDLSVQWLNVPRSADFAPVRETVSEVFAMEDRPTALICGADDYVPAIFEQLHALGLKVPTDVSLVSWNDALPPQAVPIELTSVRIDFTAVGRTAAETLCRMLSDNPPDPAWLEGQVKPAELIVRKSTAPPAD